MSKTENKCPESGATCGCGKPGGCGGAGSKRVWILLAAAVIGVLMAKAWFKKEPTPDAAPAAAPAAGAPAVLPRLVDLGAGKCVPCKMMAPVLDDLKHSYSGRLEVVFIDVWENPDAGDRYGVKIIPTQIFYDASGTERFRHEGFFGKDEILAKWKELGVDLAPAPP